MKNLIALLILALVAWGGYGHFRKQQPVEPLAVPSGLTRATPGIEPAAQRFTCDGRTRCPQMRSCAEAMYFIQHCPNTKMDGDGDGVPCESQWCGQK